MFFVILVYINIDRQVNLDIHWISIHPLTYLTCPQLFQKDARQEERDGEW
jgi:hypothetical protein